MTAAETKILSTILLLCSDSRFTADWQGMMTPMVQSGCLLTLPCDRLQAAEQLVKFYNKRGTAEQWIKEGKYAFGFLMRETVGVCPKSPFYGIFKATGLDFGGNNRIIRKKMFRVIALR